MAAASAGAIAAGGGATSPRIVERDDLAFGIRRARLIRDPDGHGLLVGQ